MLFGKGDRPVPTISVGGIALSTARLIKPGQHLDPESVLIAAAILP